MKKIKKLGWNIGSSARKERREGGRVLGLGVSPKRETDRNGREKNMGLFSLGRRLGCCVNFLSPFFFASFRATKDRGPNNSSRV